MRHGEVCFVVSALVSLIAVMGLIIVAPAFAGQDTPATIIAGDGTAHTTWYLAEGSTKWGFDTAIIVENPTTLPARIVVTFMTDTGPLVQPALTLPASSNRRPRSEGRHRRHGLLDQGRVHVRQRNRGGAHDVVERPGDGTR